MERRIKGSAVRADGGKSEPGVTRFVVSTPDEARDGHVIDQSSWLLDAYRSNPVVLWAHDYDTPPIGKALDVSVQDGKLHATVQWDVETVLGATVARQYEEGYLSAVSVGWRSHAIVSRAGLEKDHPYYSAEGGLLFRENEMLEFSAVPVPADPGALAIRGLPPPKLRDMTIDEAQEWLRGVVTVPAPASGPPKIGLDAILSALREPAVKRELREIIWSEGAAGDESDATDWLRELDTDEADDPDDFWRD